MKKIVLLLHILFQLFIVKAQTGKVLIIVNQISDIYIDGEKVGQQEPSIVGKYDLSAGEHIVQAKAGEKSIDEIVAIEEGKQKVLRLTIPTSVVPEPVFQQANSADSNTTPIQTIASLDFRIPGAIPVGIWLSEHPDEVYDSYPKYYYSLEKGDELIIDFTMDNKKGQNMIEVSTYPDGNMVYTNNSFQTLTDLVIKVPKRSIYKIEFATNHALDRNCNVTIKRRPVDIQSASFNTKVVAKIVTDTVFKTEQLIAYEAVPIQPPSEFWINSGSNADFKGGKSRITIPVNLPANTVEWYYVVSATRDESAVKSTTASLKLFGEITQLLTKTSGVGFAVSLLTQPPGADFCDVYLLSPQNRVPFETKQDTFRYVLQGSRLNVKSGIAKIDCCTTGQWYLGIRNPDYYVGESVSIEIVAIVKKTLDKFVRKPVKVVKKTVFVAED